MANADPSAGQQVWSDDHRGEKAAFLAAIGRELSNAFGPVLLGIERLRPILASGDTARALNALDSLERAGAGFARRARLLQYLAYSGPGTALKREPVGIAPLLHDTAQRNEDAARRAGCTILVECPAALTALAASEALSLTIDEVLSNALRFAPGRPVRLAGAVSETGEVIVSVTDAGAGIDPALLPDLFSPRRHTQQKSASGLGIALSVARDLVMAMGGSIGAENRHDGGAHVFVKLAPA